MAPAKQFKKPMSPASPAGGSGLTNEEAQAALNRLSARIVSLTPRHPAQNANRLRHDLPSPYGYDTVAVRNEPERSRALDPSLLIKRSWNIALAPLKGLPQMMFIMWMAGNQISIWSIMMVGYMVFRPIKAVFTVTSMFEKIEGDLAIIQRMVYLFGELVCCGLALYKVQAMGLLPLNPSDWAASEQPPRWLEYGIGPNG